MDPERHFHVLIGAPSLVDHLPVGPCCVIDADQDQLDRLAQDLAVRPHAHGCELRCAVLARQADAAIVWYRFNDRRWDGTQSLSAFCEGRPNLQLRDRSIRVGTELAALLDGLSQRVDAMQFLTVTVAQGDPLAVVEAGGAWLERTEALQLVAPEAEACWAQLLEARLQPLGFKRSRDGALTWKRTTGAMQRMCIKQLKDQRNSLAQERDDLKRYLQESHDAMAELERRHQEQMGHLKLQLEGMVQASAARIDLIRDLLAPRLKEP